MLCKECNKEIPTERLEALPHTEYCIGCADKHTPQMVGYMVYSHKTAPELVMVDARDKEMLRQAERAHRREL